METNFELPVLYKGQELALPMRLAVFGYTYRFVITLEQTEITIEKDEQGELRALMDPEQAQEARIDIALLQAIIHSIEQII